MQPVLKFIVSAFNLKVLSLFLFTAFVLLYFDARYYKRFNLKREYKLSKYAAYFFIAAGIVLYIAAKYIRL